MGTKSEFKLLETNDVEKLERDIKRSRSAQRTHARRVISEAKELSLVFGHSNPETRNQKIKNYIATLKKKVDTLNELDNNIPAPIMDGPFTSQKI